jgi:addiction module RelB/DinJ family antitoxin
MQTMLSIKIDRSLKNQARKTAHALGVSLNAVINQYIKEFIAYRQITFIEYLEPNKKTQKLLDEIENDIQNGKNLFGPFDSIDEFKKSLKSK